MPIANEILNLMEEQSNSRTNTPESSPTIKTQQHSFLPNITIALGIGGLLLSLIFALVILPTVGSIYEVSETLEIPAKYKNIPHLFLVFLLFFSLLETGGGIFFHFRQKNGISLTSKQKSFAYVLICIPVFLAVSIIPLLLITTIYPIYELTDAVLEEPENSVTPSQPPLVTNETANWKTYRNEQYGYIFQYPTSWKHVYEKCYGPDTSLCVDKQSFLRGESDTFSDFEVDISTWYQEDSFEDLKELVTGRNRLYLKTLQIGSIPMILGFNQYPAFERNNDNRPKYYLWASFLNSEKTQQFTFVYKWPALSENAQLTPSQLTKQLQEFEQILSTFRFAQLPTGKLSDSGQTTTQVWTPICTDTSKPFSVAVKTGDSQTTIARNVLISYFNTLTLTNLDKNQSSLLLLPEERVYAEDYIVKHTDLKPLTIGATKSIPCSTVEEAALRSRVLTMKQRGNLTKYSNTVSNFVIQEIIRKVLEESDSSSTSPDDLNVGVIQLGN